ncbi:MAG: choice-of-anchor L domain-containing protein [Phaeodactylibacter sp.]|nr:choice-of-anchor L domain-containing protein [Phaeodactylibacter sp.]
MAVRIITWMVFIFCSTSLAAQFTVTSTDDTQPNGPVQLIEDVCLGEGVDVLSIEYEGKPRAVGRFWGGTDVIGLNQGFIMTTGHAGSDTGLFGVDEVSNLTASVSNNSTASYDGLVELTNNGDIYDVGVYRIRFIPRGDTIMFRYVFASDEYPDFVCTNFNDVFGFFLSGPNTDGDSVTVNLARVPGTDLPVSINSVNNGQLGTHPFVNLAYCQSPNGSLDYAQFFNQTPNNTYPIFNGYTDVFVAKAAVIPCREYTMELVIADIGDPFYDSGLFFEAKSFCSFTGNHNPESLVVSEGCAPASLELSLDGFSDVLFPLSFTVGGTATLGADYTGLDSTGLLMSPADTWAINLDIADDGLDEGPETVEIMVQGDSCIQKKFTIYITGPIHIEGPPNAGCSGGPVTLKAVGDSLALSAFSLEWSTGDTTDMVAVTPNGTTVYELTYGNELSSCTASFTVAASDTTEYNRFLCREESVEVNGVIYDYDNPSGVEVFQTVAGCDSVVLVNLSFFPRQESNLEVTVQEGEAFSLAGQDYIANGAYELAFPDENGCDSLVRLRLYVQARPSLLTDSIAVGQTVGICLDTSIFQSVASFANACAPTAGAVSFQLGSSACLDYMGLMPGVDTACLVVCDGFGLCDTTYLTVSVFTNLLAATDDRDTTLYNEPIVVDVLANDWTSSTTLTDQYIVDAPFYGSAVVNADGTVSYNPGPGACLAEDVFTYAICNDIGCDTATVFIWLDAPSAACRGVWPGDVNNDGKVNQVDHWAIGLGYGQSGPARPGASLDWVAQPMINWGSTITFIYQFNSKYADCNGNGLINSDDTYAIYLNWGLTHSLAPQAPGFPNKTAASGFSRETETALAFSLGSAQQPLADAYGLAFEVHYAPGSAGELSFDAGDSWLGEEGQDMMVLQKWDDAMGIGYISLVRTTHTAVTGHGLVGRVILNCSGGDCDQLGIRNIQLLQADGHAFDIGAELPLEGSVTEASEALARQVAVYPNPAMGLLKAEVPAQAEAELWPANGGRAWRGRLEQGLNEIDVSNLQSGVYALMIQMEKGTVAKRVVLLSGKK